MERVNQKIKRFCELVVEIKNANDYLDKAAYDFYSGGHTFEECYEGDIKELEVLQNEFKQLLIDLTNEN